MKCDAKYFNFGGQVFDFLEQQSQRKGLTFVSHFMHLRPLYQCWDRLKRQNLRLYKSHILLVELNVCLNMNNCNFWSQNKHIFFYLFDVVDRGSRHNWMKNYIRGNILTSLLTLFSVWLITSHIHEQTLQVDNYNPLPVFYMYWRYMLIITTHYQPYTCTNVTSW